MLTRASADLTSSVPSGAPDASNEEQAPMPQSASHTIISKSDLQGMQLVELTPQEQCRVSVVGQQDDGHHPYGNDWWVNRACPFAFKYLALDALYPTGYFSLEGHPDTATGRAIYEYMQKVFRDVFGRPFASVLELGTGGGEITREFALHELDYLAVEGTTAGVATLAKNGIDMARVVHADLKFLPDLKRSFDLVMCTEVAEHIEPFFASKLVDNCIRHGDVVWFSAADRNRRAHYHHINEQDIEVWDNLFAHMGFPFYIALSGLHERASRLYFSKNTGMRLRGS